MLPGPALLNLYTQTEQRTQAKRKYTEALALMERYDGAFSAAEDARIEEVDGPGPPVGG